jgi:alkaline phosphatase D
MGLYLDLARADLEMDGDLVLITLRQRAARLLGLDVDHQGVGTGPPGDRVEADQPGVQIARQVNQPAAPAEAAADEVEGITALRARVPVLATWDDHDYGQNDGGADFAHKEAAKDLFLDFWDIAADDPRAGRPGIYHAETFGPPGSRVQVILLDTRSFRSSLKRSEKAYVPDPDPAKTMLGEGQWAWLRTQLEQPAELRLIVSSVQVLAEGHGFERWGNLPLERRRLFELIAQTGAGGAVFVSGDRHVGALYRLSAGVPYDFYEITSSGLTMAYADNREPGPLRLGEVYRQYNFGTIDIDWTTGEVTLSVRDTNGAVVRSATIPIATLTR